MTKVLVTGVAGFIGSHVAEACLRLGFKVYGIDEMVRHEREPECLFTKG